MELLVSVYTHAYIQTKCSGLSLKLTSLKGPTRGFPGGPVVKESNMQHKGRWFDPWYRKTSRATELLARVAQLLRACAPQCEKTPR